MEAQKQNLPLPVLVGTIVLLIGILILPIFLLTRNLSAKVNTQKAAPTIVPNALDESVYFNLPAQFPRDLPLIKRAKVTTSEDVEGTITAVFLVTSSVDEAKEFYEKELPTSGWLITNQSQGGGLTIFYTEKNTKEAIIAVGRGDEGTTISITILKRSS